MPRGEETLVNEQDGVIFSRQDFGIKPDALLLTDTQSNPKASGADSGTSNGSQEPAKSNGQGRRSQVPAQHAQRRRLLIEIQRRNRHRGRQGPRRGPT